MDQIGVLGILIGLKNAEHLNVRRALEIGDDIKSLDNEAEYFKK
jgi:hypothetical protein